ncbi:type II toxin-antitoxin system prevent-host-death family antitoxin [Streptomyces sp. RFCAC02]|uniref:type II toxin-antitoxin system prevent-host-death family antitoxin n=1 Tax=Streptomyces sp. RFCAC02 TaxID=2499143 RepID=UPI00143CCC12|nr:type II toxin-antitoxin system prevent-host-death family antitoxin [Streptomyces sp. RFCAC02]
MTGLDAGSQTVPIEAARTRLTELVRAAGEGRTTRLRDRDSGAEACLGPLAPGDTTPPAGWPVWTVTDARPRLGDLVRGAAAGRPVVLARRGRPIARLTGADQATNAPAVSLGDLLDSLTTARPAADAVPTGLAGLDDVTAGGLRPGRLTVVTAPPGSGATTLALHLARTAALDTAAPRPVLVASGRLSRADVLARVLAAEAGVDLHRITAGTLPDDQRRRLADTAARLRTAPLHLGDDLPTLRRITETAGRIDGPALVVIDPVTHVTAEPGSGPLPLALRRLARDLQTAVVAVAPADAPGTEELRDEADLALRLDRDGDLVRLTVERHRHGPTAAWPLRADFAHARLREDPAAGLPDRPPPPGPPARHPETADAPAPAPVPPEPRPAAGPVAEPDRDRAGRALQGEREPCVLCGRPTPYRAGGRPQHLGGMCVTAPTVPAPAAPPTPPGRSARPVRRATSGVIGRNVEKALADHGGDADAATAALIKRAIPDAMALLNSTRVGGTYDFTLFLNLDEIPILKKPSRDGADQIWEGRPKWRNPGISRTGGTAWSVTALDVNGAYLSALKCHLPIGKLVHSTDGTYDRKRSGLYLVTPPEWAHEDLPNPLGNREEPGPLWITDPTLRLLLRLSEPRTRLCAPPVIHESWTSGSSESLLERFRRELAAARERAIADGDTVTQEYVKAMYAKFVSTIGESSANREMRRPDWMHIIRSRAFANLWLKAWKAREAGLEIVQMMGTDELHVIGDWREVFTEGRALTEMKLKSEYTIGGGD